MTDSTPQWQPDVPFDTMAGGREPDGTSPDVMAVPKRPSDVMAGGREPAGEDPDVLRGRR
jgi:hypothetical protein